ncbi:MAG: iron-sulfur cluster repair protein YtfE [Lautropia sp.]
MDYLDRSLGRLAREIPGATGVFDTHQLDFCCGGNRTLRTAAAAAGVDAAPVVAALRALADRAADGSERNWSEAGDAELIEHILNRYHATHREQLPELLRLARKVEQVHRDRADCPHGLGDHLYAMTQALESHMRKEEAVLFPMMIRGAGALATAPIMVMRAEHDDHGTELRRLAGLTDDLTLPPAACATWRALYTGLKQFREDLMAHIHLENNVLFERFAPAAVH